MKRALTVIFAAALLVAAPLGAADPDRWLNVNVLDKSDGTKVDVHLPLQLVIAVLNSVDVENLHGGKVELDIEDADIDWPQLLTAVKGAPDGEFVKVDAPDAQVQVSKRAGTLYVNVVETGDEHANVNVTLPMSMIDALKFDEANQIDVAALLTSLDQLPNGDLVTVEADDATVRVWVE
ncbi:MAG TPA: hypothetical protein PKJ99_01550 [Thermoanaerobaculales bacterium]|nr:hypothetical protein [Thermoanaerobaculales bacterium]HPA79199.1 hypothetical protein [Thermoanaerobaculales bacterium]HQL29132.1 hypothetical protein [Thermoanaerobaculales bacterium]HQN95054.1 hypothetical protein [Thermoanaerobaculales bacterium]HQP42237.1 hypothetical protein [Thermoanaerobaculales bacterium]